MAGVRITQLVPEAVSGRRYGSFAGKTLAPHDSTMTGWYVSRHRRRTRKCAWVLWLLGV